MHICNCTKVYFADGTMKYLSDKLLKKYRETGVKPKGGHR